nr:metal-dependent transcriptional regulator [uncultured Caproiciproducens sp.]
MLSSSKKRYLFAIYELGFDGREVRCKDIAASLQVKRPSVSKMLNFLTEDGIIEKECYGSVHFTDEGARMANKLYTNYLLLCTFFFEQLHVSAENSRHDAIFSLCDLSDESIEHFSEIVLKLGQKM